MNPTRTIALTLAAVFAAGLTLIPTAAQAQFRTRRGDTYSRPYPASRDWVVRPSVVRAERESNAFRAWFERNYARLRLRRDRDDRFLKSDVQSMDEAMERLRGRASDGRPGAGRDELQDALGHARTIDREIFRNRDARFTYREWLDLRDTLNGLARLYDVRGV